MATAALTILAILWAYGFGWLVLAVYHARRDADRFDPTKPYGDR